MSLARVIYLSQTSDTSSDFQQKIKPDQPFKTIKDLNFMTF